MGAVSWSWLDSDIASNIIGNIMRVVLDTNVLVAGLVSARGASHALLTAEAAGRLKPLASTVIWLEYESVLKRDEIRALHHLGLQQIDSFLAALSFWVEPVALHYLWRPWLRDPGDDMVLELAVNGQAQAIVTHNMRDFSGVLVDFGLQVLTPAQCLDQLEIRR